MPRCRSNQPILAAISAANNEGRMAGTDWRALVEADISRFKGVIGDGLRSCTDRCRATEVGIAVVALNRMLELGRLKHVRLP